MKKLLLLCTLTIAVSPAFAAPKPAQQSSVAKRIALFVRDTAIGTVLGLAAGIMWHFNDHQRNGNNNGNINQPPAYDATDVPPAPGGPNMAPVGNQNHDKILLCLGLGAAAGALVGVAEVANDCIPEGEKQALKPAMSDDEIFARKLQQEEWDRIKAQRGKR